MVCIANCDQITLHGYTNIVTLTSHATMCVNMIQPCALDVTFGHLDSFIICVPTTDLHYH